MINETIFSEIPKEFLDQLKNLINKYEIDVLIGIKDFLLTTMIQKYLNSLIQLKNEQAKLRENTSQFKSLLINQAQCLQDTIDDILNSYKVYNVNIKKNYKDAAKKLCLLNDVDGLNNLIDQLYKDLQTRGYKITLQENC